MEEGVGGDSSRAGSSIGSGARLEVLPAVGGGLETLFCGVNPGLSSYASGLCFDSAGNRFWQVLHEAGFTPRRFTPAEQFDLPALGVGITCLVARATAGAAELTRDELRAGVAELVASAARYRCRRRVKTAP